MKKNKTIPSVVTKNGYVDTLMACRLLQEAKFTKSQAEIITDLLVQTHEETLLKKYAEERLASIEDVKRIEKDIENNRGEVEKTKIEVLALIETSKSCLVIWVSGLLIVQTGVLFTLVRTFG